MKVEVFGIPWYQKEDYARILEVMEDADRLPCTYQKWRETAVRLERKARFANIIAVRAIIYPDEFLVWCKTTGYNVSAPGRLAFANFIARRYLEEGVKNVGHR